jgi:hypothetical protein
MSIFLQRLRAQSALAKGMAPDTRAGYGAIRDLDCAGKSSIVASEISLNFFVYRDASAEQVP